MSCYNNNILCVQQVEKGRMYTNYIPILEIEKLFLIEQTTTPKEVKEIIKKKIANSNRMKIITK